MTKYFIIPKEVLDAFVPATITTYDDKEMFVLENNSVRNGAIIIKHRKRNEGTCS